MRLKLFSAAFAAAFVLITAPAYADVIDIEQDASAPDNEVAFVTHNEPAVEAASDEVADDAATANPNDKDDGKVMAKSSDPAKDAPETVEGNQAETSTTETVTETVIIDKHDMHRLYNPNSGEHFYTASEVERDHLIGVGWSYEGIGWMAPATSEEPVFRLYNPNAGDHHYTLSAYERDYLVGVGWNDEGIGWYSALGSEGIPVHRQYNPNAIAGAHNFTTSDHENASLINAGWNGEGVAWYALASDTKTVETTKPNVIEKAPYITATFTAANGTVPETIVSYAKGEETYLFLPSYAPLDNLYLSAYMSKAEQVNLYLGNEDFSIINPEHGINLLSLGPGKNPDGSLSFKFKTSNTATPFALTVMRSENVPAIYINSNDISSQGRDFIEASPDHSAKASVAVHMVDSDGSVIYDKDAFGDKKTLSSIKGRGNSTWGNGVKKPYQVSLSSKADLIGTDAPAKKWILLANSADATLLHSSVAFNLAAELGLATVDVRPIDLYYDGEYRGSYLLAEKIEIKPGRVDIFDLEEAIENANLGTDLDVLPTKKATNKYGNEFQYVVGVKDPSNIEGGYLLELDNGYYAAEKCWFTAIWPGDGAVAHFVLKSPEYASKNAVAYISEAIQEALDNLYADKLADGSALSDGSFAFDLDSFAKMYLLEEFLKNNDTYTSSTYFYLDKDSKVVQSGPVWDFDAGMGTRIDAHDSIQSSYWGYYLTLHNTIMSNQVKKRIQEIYEDTFRDLVQKVVLGDENAVGPAGKLRSINNYAKTIAASQRMNEIPFGVTSFTFQAEPFETWELNVEFFQKWLGWRLDWFDENVRLLGSATLGQQARTTRWYNGFDYGYVFDYQYYLEQNPELRKLGITTSGRALEHFATIGIHDEKYSGKTARNFDVQAYMNNNPDLKEKFGDDLAAYYKHYCTEGFKKGLVCW